MVGFIQESVIKMEGEERIMYQLKNEEMRKVKGGAGVTATMLNAVIRTVATMFSMGQAIGSAIRRISGGNYC